MAGIVQCIQGRLQAVSHQSALCRELGACVLLRVLHLGDGAAEPLSDEGGLLGLQVVVGILKTTHHPTHPPTTTTASQLLKILNLFLKILDSLKIIFPI